MKLKTKIHLFASIFITLLLLVINASIYFLFEKISIDEEMKELEIVTKDVIAALNSNPDIPPSGIISAYLPANGMIRVVQSNGSPMFESTRSGDYRTLPWKFTKQEERRVKKIKNAPRIAVIEKPIVWATGDLKGEIVMLQVSNHLVSLHNTTNTLVYVLVILSVVMLLPALLAANVLSRFLLKPIQNLRETMQDNMESTKWQKLTINNRSIDEIYEMGSTFNKMIDFLREGYENQEIFVSDASHELKTPIHIIKSYAQLMKRRGQNNPQLMEEAIEAIDSEADRMQKLVEQMLVLARNQEMDRNEEIDLVAMANEVVDTFSKSHGRKINYYYSAKQLFVRGNTHQLKQVLYILIDNGLKYSQGEIDVSLSHTEDLAILQVEIAETSLLQNEKAVLLILDELKKMGIKVLLDDFGTGYSSLSTLKKFQGKIDILKVDRSFIEELSNEFDNNSNFITKMIIDLANHFNMEVVAEGVETREQLEILKSYNCSRMQGYLFSKPVPANEFAKLLKKETLNVY